MESNQDRSQSNIPIPDPSTLTIELLRRELASQKEFFLKDVQRLEEVARERLNGVNARFDDSEKALETALSNRKEAAEKSEASFAKQIDSVSARVDDIKGRLDTGEGNKTGSMNTITLIVSVSAIIIALAFGILELSLNSNKTTLPSVVSTK